MSFQAKLHLLAKRVLLLHLPVIYINLVLNPFVGVLVYIALFVLAIRSFLQTLDQPTPVLPPHYQPIPTESYVTCFLCERLAVFGGRLVEGETFGIKLRCGHEFCSRCLGRHLERKLGGWREESGEKKKKKKVFPIWCPACPDGITPISREIAILVLDEDGQTTWDYQEELDLTPHFSCPRHDCQKTLFKYETYAAFTANEYECPWCKSKVCMFCEVFWHEDSDCTGYQRDAEALLLAQTLAEDYERLEQAASRQPVPRHIPALRRITFHPFTSTFRETTCGYCERDLGTKLDLLNHLRMTRDHDVWSCCGKLYRGNEDLVDHQTRNHRGAE